MNIYKLPRPFIYPDVKSLDDYLNENSLNPELYQVYLKNMGWYEFSYAPEFTFSKAYYLATVAMYDPHPELSFQNWKILESVNSNRISDCFMENFIIGMVYVILSLIDEKPNKIKWLLPLLFEKIGEDAFIEQFTAIVQNPPKGLKLDLRPAPLPVNTISQFDWDWREVLDNYEEDTVRELVYFFPTKEERLKFLDLIEQDYDYLPY